MASFTEEQVMQLIAQTVAVALQLAGLQAQVALGEPQTSHPELYQDVDYFLPQRIKQAKCFSVNKLNTNTLNNAGCWISMQQPKGSCCMHHAPPVRRLPHGASLLSPAHRM